MIIPIKKEALTSENSPEHIEDNLNRVIIPGKRNLSSNSGYLFTGKLKNGSFDLIKVVDRPENFMPKVEGFIEKSDAGSVIFMKYTLQFSSRMFVVFWSLTTMFFALFLWFIEIEVVLGFLSLGGLFTNLLITHLNFRKKINEIRKILQDVFDR